MSNPTRPDVVANKRLDRQYDLDSLSFEDARWLLHDFINDVLISNNQLDSLGVSQEVISKAKFYNDQIKRYLVGDISSEEINAIGVTSWSYHDTLTGNSKDAIRFVMAGLCDRGKALFDEYGPSMHIGTLVSMIYRIGGKALCNEFVDYLHRYPAMKKYRRADQNFPDG